MNLTMPTRFKATESDIRELMRLTGWRAHDLATQCNVGENAVHQWLAGRVPGGPASKLIEIYLKQAREEAAKPIRNGRQKVT